MVSLVVVCAVVLLSYMMLWPLCEAGLCGNGVWCGQGLWSSAQSGADYIACCTWLHRLQLHVPH